MKHDCCDQRLTKIFHDNKQAIWRCGVCGRQFLQKLRLPAWTYAEEGKKS